MLPALATTSLDFAAVLASASVVRALIAPETVPLLSRLPEASAVTDTTVSTAGGEAVTTGPDVHVCAWERREGARASGGAVLGAAGGLTSLLDEIDRYGLQSWEVVSVVPSTYGGFPSHKSAKCHVPRHPQYRRRFAGGSPRRPSRRRVRPAEVWDQRSEFRSVGGAHAIDDQRPTPRAASRPDRLIRPVHSVAIESTWSRCRAQRM